MGKDKEEKPLTAFVPVANSNNEDPGPPMHGIPVMPPGYAKEEDKAVLPCYVSKEPPFGGMPIDPKELSQRAASWSPNLINPGMQSIYQQQLQQGSVRAATTSAQVIGLPLSYPPHLYYPSIYMACAPGASYGVPPPYPMQSKVDKPVDLTPSMKLGKASINDLPKGAHSILHPVLEGYVTIHLIQRGTAPIIGLIYNPRFDYSVHLAHPGTTVNDLICGLLGKDSNEAKKKGIAIWGQTEYGQWYEMESFRQGQEKSENALRDSDYFNIGECVWVSYGVDTR